MPFKNDVDSATDRFLPNCGISSRSRIHPPDYFLCIPSHKPPSFSLLAWHPNLFFLNSPSQYQSISPSVYPLSDYQHTITYSFSNPVIFFTWPNHWRTPSILSSTLRISVTTSNCSISSSQGFIPRSMPQSFLFFLIAQHSNLSFSKVIHRISPLLARSTY